MEQDTFAKRGRKARAERECCRAWLLPYATNNHPRFLTKTELRDAAKREHKISKNSFDFAWIAVIEETGRHEWYEPLPRQRNIRH